MVDELECMAGRETRRMYFVKEARDYQSDIRDRWSMTFEVCMKDKQLQYIKLLDQGSDGKLFRLPLKALLKLVNDLEADGVKI